MGKKKKQSLELSFHVDLGIEAIPLLQKILETLREENISVEKETVSEQELLYEKKTVESDHIEQASAKKMTQEEAIQPEDQFEKNTQEDDDKDLENLQDIPLKLYKSGGLYCEADSLLQSLNQLVTRCRNANESKTNVDELRELYYQTEELIKAFGDIRIETFVNILQKMDDNIQCIQDAISTMKDDMQAYTEHINNERKYVKNLHSFLKKLGADILKPKIGDSYDEDTMEAENLDEIDKSADIFVEKVVKYGYCQLLNGKKGIQKCLVYVTNEEQKHDGKSK